MKKRILALSLAAMMALPFSASAEASNASFTSLYSDEVLSQEINQPITRAKFSMLAFEAFRLINSGVFPQMEAKNIFSDVGEEPEDMFVVMLYGMGIVNGVSSDSFAPRRSITRQEMCTILTRAKLLQNPDILTDVVNAENSLASVQDAAEISAWAKTPMGYLYEKGVVNAVEGKLLPNEIVTTEEAIEVCTRFANI